MMGTTIGSEPGGVEDSAGPVMNQGIAIEYDTPSCPGLVAVCWRLSYRTGYSSSSRRHDKQL